MIDSNITRWMASSAAKHFKDAADGAGVKLYLNSYSGKDGEWAEFRFDGPIQENSTIGTFSLGCTINILVTCFISDNDYRIFDLAGIFASAMDSDICVFKYGDGDEDDQSLIGSLQLFSNKIDTVHYGLIAAEAQQKRSSVEATYTMKW